MPASGRPLFRLPTLLRTGPFRRYWAGRTTSLVGGQISSVAFPLTAVLVLHANAAIMGLVTAAGMSPSLFFSMVAGAWLDRYGHRRRVMIWADIARALLWGSIPLAYALGDLSLLQLVLVSFVGGTFGVLSRLASTTVFVSVVPSEQYVEASALIETGEAGAWLVGPSLAGLLVEWFAAPLALLADAASFIASAWSLGGLAIAEPAPATPERGHAMAGLQFVRRHPILKATLLASSTLSLFRGVYLALYVLYVVTRLHVTPLELGIILGPGSIGALWGATIARRFTERLGIGRSLIWSTLLHTVPLILVPLAWGPHWFVVALLLLAECFSGMGLMIQQVGDRAIMAAAIPDPLRARVNGAFSFFTRGIRPPGALLGGAVAAAVGLHWVMWVVTLGAITSVLWLIWSPLAHAQTIDRLSTSPPA